MKKAIYHKDTRTVEYVDLTPEEVEELNNLPVPEPVITQDEINCDMDYRLSMVELGLL